MKYLTMRVTASSPLAIRADHAPGGATNAEYISGTTFLGSLAALYRLHIGETGSFTQLFLNEQVLYPNLYPALFKDRGLQGQNNTPVYPLPTTAQSCKRHPGFRFPYNLPYNDEDNDGHGVRDALIDWALVRLSLDNAEAKDDSRNSPNKNPEDYKKLLDVLRDHNACRDCGEALDHFAGYYRRGTTEYRRGTTESRPMIGADSYTRLQTRTGINRESGTVQEGILYNRQVFEEGMQFWGQAIFPDDGELIKSFETFIKEIGHTGLLRIGTGRTRGMGKVTLAVEQPDDDQDRFTLFSQRLQAFNDLFHNRASDFQLDTHSHSYFFALTLHSPLILCDDLLRYRTSIDANVLQELLKEEQPDCIVPDLKLIYYAASVRRVTGWLELWGTPRMSEYAIETGSVFLFACPSPLDNALLQALFALEEHGIGKRRGEGFGRVCVSDQFHQQIQQETPQEVVL